MSKEKFDWKALFVNVDKSQVEEDSKAKKVVEKAKPSQNFPDSPKSTTQFPKVTPKQDLSESVLASIIEMYEAGFEGLNQPGYDFYEFFKAIQSVGSNDPQMYKMALTMAQSVDSKITKSSLLEQSDFYIAEIEKVHQKYEGQGKSKKEQIQNAQKVKKENLVAEISSLEKQLRDIQNQISSKKKDLQSIDINMLAEVSEIDQKITANDVAKSKILDTIMVVVNGINKNI
ncbi:hypothetical protein JKA74_07795 [Marivirga sp. S37H4]|uniref:Uncharacterized protein n=1 Tax=Marivirga aurantiaca TaxID=2802615 RepID=A0A934WY44_9BACT|nr:hypothetical protein [Marivirga aurantiaca]MBK6264935.1 hypothetical protein [Marivirga aurantiaca]